MTFKEIWTITNLN